MISHPTSGPVGLKHAFERGVRSHLRAWRQMQYPSPGRQTPRPLRFASRDTAPGRIRISRKIRRSDHGTPGTPASAGHRTPSRIGSGCRIRSLAAADPAREPHPRRQKKAAHWSCLSPASVPIEQSWRPARLPEPPPRSSIPFLLTSRPSPARPSGLYRFLRGCGSL